MKCVYCGSRRVVKNGKSRHGFQRWKCKDCGKTCGEFDRRTISEEIRKVALERYLAGKGLRATERVVGVSHNSVMKWVFDSARKELAERALPDKLEWFDQAELHKHAEKESWGSSGIVVVLPKKFAAGKWGVLKPKNPAVWMRLFIKMLLDS